MAGTTSRKGDFWGLEPQPTQSYGRQVQPPVLDQFGTYLWMNRLQEAKNC